MKVPEGSSPGSGIPGTRRLMDGAILRSAGGGTIVTTVKWLPNS